MNSFQVSIHRPALKVSEIYSPEVVIDLSPGPKLRPRLAKSLKPAYNRGEAGSGAIRQGRGPPSWSTEEGRKGKWSSETQEPVTAQKAPEPIESPVYKRKDLDYEATAEDEEFYNPPTLVTTGGSTEISASLKGAPTRFNTPPLLPGFVYALRETLGQDARPTPIQSLSMKWLFDKEPAFEWNQFLLASETGSGKSIGYLLPVLQHLKETEGSKPPPTPSSRPLNPRAIILAPTHELSRQLSVFAKSLLHSEKLRVVCASQANTKSQTTRDATASEMAAQFDSLMGGGQGEFAVHEHTHPVDVLVGTPMKIMEMIRGRGWDRREMTEEDATLDPKTLRRGRDKMVGVGKWRSKPELGLENVQWVVVDEADVLLDPDFQEVTRTLLADISAARGCQVSVDPLPTSPTEKLPENQDVEYPFHLVLTSATIPSTLARKSQEPAIAQKAPEPIERPVYKWKGLDYEATAGDEELVPRPVSKP
ncbi:hypothetical protein H1R20_g1245, partial [Candolleomyces eurysporus]